MKFLFVVPPFTGHTNPTVSVARELEARGHQAAWVGHMGAIGHLLPEGAVAFDLGGSVQEDLLADLAGKAGSLRGLANLKFFCEDVLVPLGRSMREGVERAVDRFSPDALVVDQQALAGAIVARRRGLPWATSATTSAVLREVLAGLPKVLEWFEEQQATLQREAGLEPVADLENSPHLVIVFTTEALAGDASRFPSHWRLVGPALAHREERVEFPFEALDERRKVLVSLGTLNARRGERLFGVVREALGGAPDLQVVLVAPDEFGPFPDNFVQRPFVPQLALLPRMDVVVCHAGHNTVCESLAHGLPLVMTPIKDDQTVVAQQVVEAGAGLRLRFARVRPERLAEAVRTVLDEPRFRAAAERVGESFRRAGGARRAAELLEGLLA